MDSSTSLGDRLCNGEKVKCLKCEEGYYEPLNPKVEVNHLFICPICGDTVHIEANVVVE